MSAAIGKTSSEPPVSAPDLTYTKNRKSTSSTSVDATAAAGLLLSSPQAAVSPGGYVSLLLTVSDTQSLPLSGLVAEICCNQKSVSLIRETVWYFSSSAAPTQLVPRLDDGILLDLPEKIEAGGNGYVILSFSVGECDFPESIVFSTILYGDKLQPVTGNELTFRVCCANIETSKECIRGSTKNHATYRFILTNNGTGSACAVTLEDRLPNGFCVEHVLYSGFELVENVQYTVNGNLFCVHLPTCIRPQTAGELTVIGSFA